MIVLGLLELTTISEATLNNAAAKITMLPSRRYTSVALESLIRQLLDPCPPNYIDLAERITADNKHYDDLVEENRSLKRKLASHEISLSRKTNVGVL
jgi:hypothetical protein